MWTLLGDGVGAEEQRRGHAQPHHGEGLGEFTPDSLAAAVYMTRFLKLPCALSFCCLTSLHDTLFLKS